MRRGFAFLVLGALGVVIGVASAHATGVGTTGTTVPTTDTTTPATTTTGDTTTTGATTTTTTTTSTTTTSTTTTSATTSGATTTTGTTTTRTTRVPDYGPLPVSSLRVGCLGAGVAAVVGASQRPLALGTPASNLDASEYPESGSVVRLASAIVRGSGCSETEITLRSVSLFRGAVTARRVEATGGVGRVTGLTIDGRAILAPRGGVSLAVGDWGRLTLDGGAGRLTAPLVLRLVHARDRIPAGTRILIGFSAAARQRRPAKPPDYPSAPFPFTLSGGLTESAQHNSVVSIAMRYMGVRYVWGGSTPKGGFDCSGLVKYVFAQLGVPLVHYAAAQWSSPYAIAVPANRLQAGDLVFFVGSDGTWTAPGHVGIYVGDGYFIDAPHTGARVRIDTLDEPGFARMYIGARRIVDVSRALLRPRATGAAATAPALVSGFPLAGGLLGLTTAASPWPNLVRVSAVADISDVSAAGVDATGHASRGEALWLGITFGSLVLVLAGVIAALRRARSSDATATDESR